MDAKQTITTTVKIGMDKLKILVRERALDHGWATLADEIEVTEKLDALGHFDGFTITIKSTSPRTGRPHGAQL